MELYQPAKLRTWTNGFGDEHVGLYVMEKKYDDARYLLYARKGEPVALISRRLSVNGDVIDRADQFSELKELEGVGFVLDGGVTVMVRDKGNKWVEGSVNDVTSFIVSSPQKARAMVEEGVVIPVYRPYDVLELNGEYVGDLPQHERLVVLENEVGNWLEHCPEASVDGVSSHPFSEAFWLKAIEKGWEGIVIKRLDAVYGVGWSKLKNLDVSFDVVVMGFFETPKGDLSLEFGQYLNGKLWYMGRTGTAPNGTPAVERKRITEDMRTNPDKYLGRVVEAVAQCRTKPSAVKPCGGLRHSRFRRWRDEEKDAEECVYNPNES